MPLSRQTPQGFAGPPTQLARVALPVHGAEHGNGAGRRKRNPRSGRTWALVGRGSLTSRPSMGTTHSSERRRELVAEEPAWRYYLKAPWRSEKSRELDRWGGASDAGCLKRAQMQMRRSTKRCRPSAGISRAPIARNDSMTAKLVWLEVSSAGVELREPHGRAALHARTDRCEAAPWLTRSNCLKASLLHDSVS